MDTAAVDLHYLELTEIAARIRTRQISSLEVTRAQLDRIAALDGELASYVQVMADAAMAQAETAHAEIAAGRYRGPLHGVPIALKDLFWTKGCSDGRRHRRPSAISVPIKTQAWCAA